MLAEAVGTLENETNPWLNAEARFDEAAERLRLDDGMRKILRSPSRELTVYIPVQLDDGRIEVFTGYRVQHSIARWELYRQPPQTQNCRISSWTNCTSPDGTATCSRA